MLADIHGPHVSSLAHGINTTSSDKVALYTGQTLATGVPTQEITVIRGVINI